LPVEIRDSLSSISTFVAAIGNSSQNTTTIYNVPSIALVGSAGTGADATSALFTAKFQALPFSDPATGLVYARARWYSPETGTFLSGDPMGYADSSNLYAFAAGDPVNGRDPTGQCLGFGNMSCAEAWRAAKKEASKQIDAVLPRSGLKPLDEGMRKLWSGTLRVASAPAGLVANLGTSSGKYLDKLERATFYGDTKIASDPETMRDAIGAASDAMAMITPAEMLEGQLEVGASRAVSTNSARAAKVLQIRSAAEVNQLMVADGMLPAWGGTTVTTEIVPAGTRFNMVLTEEQAQFLASGRSWFGGWATTDSVDSQTFARRHMAILPEFKGDVSFMAEVETTAPQTLNRGVVGHVNDHAHGGASQVEFLGERNLRLVGKPKPLPSGPR
ncbi:MAG: hypothetical protein QOI58_3022, partial [Thermoanaerobaculia bacterium]|nr:hypothetical protein [Thermoanaerobaculia bacterium]